MTKPLSELAEGAGLARWSLAAGELAAGWLLLPFPDATPVLTGLSYSVVARRERLRAPHVLAFQGCVLEESAPLRLDVAPPPWRVPGVTGAPNRSTGVDPPASDARTSQHRAARARTPSDSLARVPIGPPSSRASRRHASRRCERARTRGLLVVSDWPRTLVRRSHPRERAALAPRSALDFSAERAARAKCLP